jgi:hypothetical protein
LWLLSNDPKEILATSNILSSSNVSEAAGIKGELMFEVPGVPGRIKGELGKLPLEGSNDGEWEKK